MFNSTILDVISGLIFCFLAISLAASTATEAVASALKWRSSTLLQGVKMLLNDPKFTGLAQEVYQHALVSPRSEGTATTERALKRAPAYINPGQFADVLMEITQIAQGAPDEIKRAIDAKVDNEQIRTLLNGMVDRTAGDVGKLRGEITGWFDSSMDRLSGAYKRQTQLWCFAIGLVLAAILNVSALHVAKALWQQPSLARSISATPDVTPAQALQSLEELALPIGWASLEPARLRPIDWGAMVLGWVITAVSTLFGAPFWFDALQRIARLKGSGPSPAEKAEKAAASA